MATKAPKLHIISKRCALRRSAGITRCYVHGADVTVHGEHAPGCAGDRIKYLRYRWAGPAPLICKECGRVMLAKE